MTCEEKLAKCVEALQEITRGMGRFSRDPYEHCNNTVEDMKELARQALAHAQELEK